MTRASGILDAYIFLHCLNPSRSAWKVGPGQVVLSASEQEREQFRQLKSEDIANFADNKLAAFMAMSEEDRQRHQCREENKKLLLAFDREVEKHKKFSI